MSDEKKQIWNEKVLFPVIGIGVLFIGAKYRARIWRKMKILLNNDHPLRNQQVHVVNNVDECQILMRSLKSHCKEYNVLGFDCEWVTINRTRRPVALMQLASHRGLCALIRLSNLEMIPSELKEILENDNIIKIGVAPQGDATYLARDYEIKVANTFDLRHMAVMCGYPSGGLAKLSKSILNVELDKNWTIICSDWEAAVLSSKQIDYAAKDAHVAIEIFKILADRLIPEPLFSSKLKHVQNILNYYCSEFFNIQYNGLCNSGKGHEINPNDYDYNLNSPAVNHVGRLDMRIGRIIKIEKAVEKDADALYLMKVNIGDEIRPIVARLAKFIPADQLLNQNVVVLCNIKPIKLKGYLSNGMILRANSEDLMEPLIPPPNAEPGDLVHCENYERAPVEKPRDKRRLYNPLFIDMATNNELVACYKSSCLYIPGKGYIVAKSLKNASIG